MGTDNFKVQSNKSENSLIRYVHNSTPNGDVQGVKVERYILTRDRIGEKVSSEKSINCIHQKQYNQVLNENPMTMTVTLCKSQCESSKESIIQLGDSRCDGKQMDQMVTPVNIPSVTCYQTVINNPEVEQTEEINSTDLRHSWGKAVSFITNTSNKLCLSSALCSLA